MRMLFWHPITDLRCKDFSSGDIIRDPLQVCNSHILTCKRPPTFLVIISVNNQMFIKSKSQHVISVQTILEITIHISFMQFKIQRLETTM